MKPRPKIHLLPEESGTTLCGKEFLASRMMDWRMTSDPSRVTCKKCRNMLAPDCPKCKIAWDRKTLTHGKSGRGIPACHRCGTKLHDDVSGRN